MDTVTDIVRFYDDGPDLIAVNREVELAYRQEFLREARRIVREWAHPPGSNPNKKKTSSPDRRTWRGCDPDWEMESVFKQRRRLCQRYTVYGPGDAGPKTYVLGFRPEHKVPAARLRGKQHAMAYVANLQDEANIHDPMLLCPWLRAVEIWAISPMPTNRIVPPPRPLNVVPHFPVKLPVDASISSLPPLGNLVTPPLGSSRSKVKLTRADQIEIRPPHWLLRGMLERDTLALVFGDPGCGKSFLVIDWACRIATGTPWRGHPVMNGPVVYVAGEGQQGFGRRIQAWSEYHDIDLADAPLYQVPSVAIPDPADLMALLTAIETGVASVGRPVMIVLDTLARCFGGGDENSTQDMSKFVAACDAIRQRYGCTVLVVHHAGHGDKSRARGAIALKAALDAEYRLENENGLLLTATKMKDAETPEPVALRLVTVELPDLLDDYGNTVTSAAVEVLDADTSAIVSQAKAVTSNQRGKWQKLGMKIAKRLIGKGDDGQAKVSDWHQACEAAGMRQSTRYNVLAKLHEQRLIRVDGDIMSTV